MSDESLAERTFTTMIETVRPSFSSIKRDVADYRKSRPKDTRVELANNWADRTCWLFAAEGAATALPGAIPGLGTVAQVAVEAGGISADILYMFRCMAGMTTGVGMIFERDVESYFNQEFVKVLGLWCGALQVAKEGTKRIGTKVAVAQFKKVPGEIFKQINKRVGTTILTKYGTKRGGIAVGKLIPFGVGALVGGGFNLATMKGFKAASIRYFENANQSLEMDQ